jgi:hypothetical protein
MTPKLAIVGKGLTYDTYLIIYPSFYMFQIDEILIG